ncbi:Tubulin-folding cofactor E [Linum perenne]
MASSEPFRLGQRVHSVGDPRRIGTVKYVGTVEGYSGIWVGVDWDTGEGKHDGTVKGTRYFQAKSENSGSLARPHNLSSGISFLEALCIRYKGQATKEEEDGMYVLSTTNRRVSVEFVGKEKIQDKLSRFEELTNASLSFLGVNSPGSSAEIGSNLPNLKELDLTGNLLSEWKDIGTICEQLPSLKALNLSHNLMADVVTGLPRLSSIRVLVLNCTGVKWTQVEELEHLLPVIEELHLMGNGISEIKSYILFSSASNNIGDLASIDALNLFPNLMDIRISENPITEPTRGGIPRYVLVARLSKVELLNGSEIRARDRKECEIRYVRLVMSQLHGKPDEIKKLHPRYSLYPRFTELKLLHGIEDERPSIESSGPQKMATGLLSITLKCVGASMGEKAPMTKKLPASTTGCPLPLLLDDEMASLVDVGAGNGSTILVDEES